eukprot:677912-Pleurochrysis_carterae.AAC.1
MLRAGPSARRRGAFSFRGFISQLAVLPLFVRFASASCACAVRRTWTVSLCASASRWTPQKTV